MQAVELSGIEGNKVRSRVGLRAVSWPHLRILLMAGICGFPALFLYGMSNGNKALAHSRASGVVAKVRVSRADSFLLVRSPLPSPATPAPKPVSVPVR